MNISDSFEYGERIAPSVDIRQVANLLLELSTELEKARRILVQMNPRLANFNFVDLAGMGTLFSPEDEEMLQAGPETAVGKSFEDFFRAITASCSMVRTVKGVWRRIRLENGNFVHPGRMQLTQAERDAFEQAENLTFSLNYELQQLWLAANASFVHGLWQSNARLSETEGVKDTLLNLIASLKAVLPSMEG